MRHIAWCAIFLTFQFTATSVSPQPVWMAGMSLDNSSNMLMRPEGDSGSVSSMYGQFGYYGNDWSALLNSNAGGVQGYSGIQYQRHSLSFLHDILSRSNLLVETGLAALFARYGEVTSLDGYNQFGAFISGKSYVRDSVLLRLQGRFNRRMYNGIETETFNEGTVWVRFDKFFSTGTTLRAQFDTGYRSFVRIEGDPSIALYGVRVRAAQSLTPDWGMWIELHSRDLDGGGAATTVSSYDRVFLDDDFMSESRGAEMHSKYLIRQSGVIEGEVYYNRRDYAPSLNSTYWYLPDNGWEEHEWGAGITFTWQPGFLPSRLTPSVELYHVDVNASIGVLSYDSTGAVFRMELY